MIFLGISFCADHHSMDPTPTDVGDMSKMVLQNAIYDDLYVSSDPSASAPEDFPDTWGYSTVLHAAFDGSLVAGNVDDSVSNMDALRIKRRVKGAIPWMTIFEKPIYGPDDMRFVLYDRYTMGDTEYEYAAVPVIAGVEGTPQISDVVSRFVGIFLVDQNNVFRSQNDMSLSTSTVNPTAILTPLDSEYPYVIKPGITTYLHGSASATFLVYDDHQYVDEKKTILYREALHRFLANGKPKVIKIDDGRGWIVGITGDPSDGDSAIRGFVSTSFTFDQVGSISSAEDLYKSGLIDVLIESW